MTRFHPSLVRRLLAIDHRDPRLDKAAAEAALVRHFKSLALPPLQVIWCNTLDEAWDRVVARENDENSAWNAFENRLTRSRPWDGPRPLEKHGLEEDLVPFAHSIRAAWTPEEAHLLGQTRFAADLTWYLTTPVRSAALAVTFALQAPSELRGPLLDLLEAAEAGLWLFWMRREDVVAILRPALRFRAPRLHCEDGPALIWPDGTRWHYWNGVRVPEFAVERPETITLKQIRAEENAEVRRVLIERYGTARYISDVGAQPTHQDRCGTLYTVLQPDDEPLVMVKVVNATPEPDGTTKEYFLRVPPGMKTPAEGVAWTFGLLEDEYFPIHET